MKLCGITKAPQRPLPGISETYRMHHRREKREYITDSIKEQIKNYGAEII